MDNVLPESYGLGGTALHQLHFMYLTSSTTNLHKVYVRLQVKRLILPSDLNQICHVPTDLLHLTNINYTKFCLVKAKQS